MIEWFGTVSGLKLNKKKTMWLGTMKHSSSKILEFKSIKDPIKAFLSNNQNKNVEENFSNKIRLKMNMELNLWLYSKIFRRVSVSIYCVHALCSDFNNKRCSKRTFLLLMEKQKRQNKKNGHVSTPRGRGFKLCKLSRCSQIFTSCLVKQISKSL